MTYHKLVLSTTSKFENRKTDVEYTFINNASTYFNTECFNAQLLVRPRLSEHNANVNSVKVKEQMREA